MTVIRALISVFQVKFLSVSVLTLFMLGCAYRFGFSNRQLPGGYTQVAIPVFKNRSQEVGIELPFTNALIRRFARSQAAEVTSKENSPLLLEGVIENVQIEQGPAATDRDIRTLPSAAVLTTEYRIVVNTYLTLKRKSDAKILWEGRFSNEIVYPAPRIGQAVLNTANVTYNKSARVEMIARLAEEMMAEAHDRMTENF